MGEPGLPAHRRLTGGQSAQINGRPRTSDPVAVWERSAAGRAYGHSWRAVGGRVAAPSKARDAGHGIQRRGRAAGGGLGRGRQANRGEARAKGLRGGPTARPFCESILLETDLVADGPRPQTPGGGLFLAIAADVLAASPADAWRQRPGSLVAHGTSRGPRLLTSRGPLTLKTGCRICASLIHTC